MIIVKRLPDINKERNLPEEYTKYGRFWITNNIFHCVGIASSHPSNIEIGGYWATNGKDLFLSPRGSIIGFDEIVNEIKSNRIWLRKLISISGINMRINNISDINTGINIKRNINEELDIRSQKMFVCYLGNPDVHDNFSARKMMSATIAKLGYKFNPNQMGRFAQLKNGSWVMDSNMSQTGHPSSSVINDTVGYYGREESKLTIFFPKASKEIFSKYLNSLSIKVRKEIIDIEEFIKNKKIQNEEYNVYINII